MVLKIIGCITSNNRKLARRETQYVGIAVYNPPLQSKPPLMLYISCQQPMAKTVMVTSTRMLTSQNTASHMYFRQNKNRAMTIIGTKYTTNKYTPRKYPISGPYVNQGKNRKINTAKYSAFAITSFPFSCLQVCIRTPHFPDKKRLINLVKYNQLYEPKHANLRRPLHNGESPPPRIKPHTVKLMPLLNMSIPLNVYLEI